MSRKDYYNDASAPQVNSIRPATTAIVVNKEGKILLERRSDSGLWGILGGVMEYGESITDTAIREIKEEAGLDIAIMYLVGIYTNPKHIIEFSDGEIRQEFSILFACEIVGGEIKISEESLELAFFNEDEINQLEMTDSTRERLNDYLAKLAKPIIK
jgi:ADP-ribose pyrophosphatase YjhB (NUDIX family)